MFYRGIEEALKSNNNHLLSVVLKNSTKLFLCPFKGIRVLIPSYVAALEKVLVVPVTIAHPLLFFSFLNQLTSSTFQRIGRPSWDSEHQEHSTEGVYKDSFRNVVL